MRTAAIITFAVSIALFCVGEVWAERRQKPGVKDEKDEESLKRIHRCRNLSLLIIPLSVYFPLIEIPVSSAARFFMSAALVLAGSGVRFGAVYQLGEWFTNVVATQSGQPLLQSGFYRYIRHPAYSGSLLVFLGVALSTGSLWGMAVIVALMTYALLRRISVEERVMIETFGDEYLAYMKTTKKLIPLAL